MYAIPSAAPGTGIGCDEQMQGSGGALRQGAQASDAAADPRHGRSQVQDRRHRRLRRDYVDGGCGL